MFVFRLLRWAFRVVVILVALVVFAAFVLQATNPKPKQREGWAVGPPLELERGEVASAVVGNKLVVIGGLRGLTTTSGRISMFDVEGAEWSDTGKIAPMHHAAAASHGKYVYVSGGAASVTDWTPSDDLYGFIPGEDATKTEMPEGRQGHAMVSLADKLYIVGGVGNTADTLIADLEKKRWTRGAALPHPRDHLRAVVHDKKIWAIGGRSGSPTNRVDIYDPKDDDWDPGPPLPEPMSAMAVGVLDDQIHVVGGENPNLIGGGVSNKHFVYNGRIWEEKTPPPLGVHGAGYGVVGNNLLIVGGASRQGALSVLSWTGTLQLLRG